MSGQNDSIPFAIWQMAGATEHLGGIYATRRLLAMCPIRPGQLLLEVGCGTGYTACLLAREYGVRVLALDIGTRGVEEARRRVAQARLSGQVSVVRADAGDLPCADASVDGVLVESVLVFCNAARVVAQMHRVLKPGGFFGANELTFLKSPAQELLCLLEEGLGIHAHSEEEWRDVFGRAGMVVLRGTTKRIRLWEQLASHVRVNGVGGYLRAVAGGLGEVRVRKTFLDRRMLIAALRYGTSVGYGLYTGRKEP